MLARLPHSLSAFTRIIKNPFLHPHISELHHNTKSALKNELQKSIMEDKCNCGESCIMIGGWGGRGGKSWSCKPDDGAILQIIIIYGGAIDSIRFKIRKPDGSIEYSPKFGGKGGDHTAKVNIDFPSEYLTEMNGTIGRYGQYDVITSLRFKTNVATHGPFGSPEKSGAPFWCPLNHGAIVGFFGHSGGYIDNIGIFVKPVCSICATKRMQIEVPTKDEEVLPNDVMKTDVMKMVVARGPGPWGGSGGKQWDDGVFCRVKQIVVHFTDSGYDAIHAVQFQYENRDGKSVWGQMHGGLGFDQTKRIILDCDNDELVAGISGYYGPIEGGVVEVVRSLCFHTNKRRYGPFGRESGPNYTYFASSSNAGVAVGFHGKSDAFLTAIGVHMEYF